MATKAELEERVDLLERRVALIEARFRTLSRTLDADGPDADERDRVRLQHIIRILRRAGGLRRSIISPARITR